MISLHKIYNNPGLITYLNNMKECRSWVITDKPHGLASNIFNIHILGFILSNICAKYPSKVAVEWFCFI